MSAFIEEPGLRAPVFTRPTKLFVAVIHFVTTSEHNPDVRPFCPTVFAGTGLCLGRYRGERNQGKDGETQPSFHWVSNGYDQSRYSVASVQG